MFTTVKSKFIFSVKPSIKRSIKNTLVMKGEMLWPVVLLDSSVALHHFPYALVPSFNVSM